MKLRKIFMLFAVLALTLGICAACRDTQDPVYYTVETQYDETLGSVTVSDPASANGYEAGERVTVTVTPNSGVEVKKVTLNGAEKELAENKLVFEVSQNTTVAVTFEETAAQPQVVTLTLPTDGTVAAAPAGPYHAGDKVTLTITAPSGQKLKSIKVNGTEKFSEVTENTLQIELTTDTTVAVEYEADTPTPQVVTLTLPTDGTVAAAPAGPYHAGDTVTLTITAPSGQKLKSIKVNNVEKVTEVTENALQIELTTDTTVTVEYEADTPSPQVVTLTLPTDGTVAAAPAGPYHAGDTVTLTITAPSGQKLKSIKVNNVEKVTEVSENTLEIELTTDTTVTVEYETDTPEVIEIGEEWWGYYEGSRSSVKYALRIGATKVELKIGDEIFAAGTLTEYKADYHIKFTLSGGTWTIEAPLSGNPYQSVMLSGGPNNLGNINCLRAEDPGLGVDDELVGVWTATGHTLTITKQTIDLDGKQATTYNKQTMLIFTTYSFTVEGVAYSGELEGDTFTLSGGTLDKVAFTRQGGQTEIPELSIPDNLVGVWTTAAGDHTMTITKTALTLDGESATEFETLQEANKVYYNFTAGGKDYTMLFGADNTLSVSEKENTGASIQFTVKDGKPIAPPEVEILEEYKGEFEGEKSGTKYHVSVKDEGIFVTIGETEPVKATLIGYNLSKLGYTFTLGDDETEYRLVNKGTGYDQMDFYYGTWITDYVTLDRVTETEPSTDLNVDDELIGEWVADGHTLTITKTSIVLDGKYATEYKKVAYVFATTYTFKIEGVEYTGTLEDDGSIHLTGGDIVTYIAFTLKSEPEIPELTVDSEIIGEWIADGHTLTITATSIELDGKYATEYSKEPDGVFTTYSFTVESVSYSGVLKSSNTVFTLTGFDGGPIDFTRKSESGEPDVGGDVTISDRYCGVFSGTNGDDTYVITVEAHKVSITINGAEQTVVLEGEDGGEPVTVSITMNGKKYVLAWATTGAKNVRLKDVDENGDTGNELNVKAERQS